MWQIEDMHRRYGVSIRRRSPFRQEAWKRHEVTWLVVDEQYWPCVRINPYEIHIIDPDFYDELYVSHKKLDKYRWWTNLAGADGSTFATVPHDLHRQRRAVLNPFFSAQSVAQVQPLIKAKVEKLCARFRSIAKTGEVVRLDAAFMALTMDVICDYAFAHDRKYLDEPDFMLLWKQTIIGAFEGGALGRLFPWMLPLMKKLPRAMVSAMDASVGHLLNWQDIVKAQVKPIIDGTDDLSRKGDTSRTIFHTLRDSDLPPHEKTLQRLCDEGEIMTGAGSETTAQTLTRIMFYICQVPDTLDKMRHELARIMTIHGGIPDIAELQALPYLSAVIKEGLRLSYGVTTRLPRIAHEDITYKDFVIPAGTPVSQTPYFSLMHPGIFPDPQRFRPERWLEAEEKCQRLNKYLVSFGKGTRQCVGLNLAYAEVYLALAAIAHRFDWTMFETGLEDVVCFHDFFVAVASLESKGVRATLRTRKI
ncbi:hypothetical protein NLU13_0243 [Sarocladium strictum]|uniref:Cytochrome P450 n=1 Tax=Sarocladium strictum TaxID=5046 RepID=A0AA39LB92_SARSR|nr:hypothetical protein NLU13_0243 [Sarocladium strictum]